MVSVKGRFQDGVVQLLEPVAAAEGQIVMITFLEESVELAQDDSGWDQLMQILDRAQMDTGIEDLAHQHDHYLYGKPKHE
jgi:hypothetical protein